MANNEINPDKVRIIGGMTPEQQAAEQERLGKELRAIATAIDEQLQGHEPLVSSMQPLTLAEAKQRPGADEVAIDEVNAHWGWPAADSAMNRTSPYKDEDEFWEAFLRQHGLRNTEDPNNFRARLRAPTVDVATLESEEDIESIGFVDVYHGTTPALLRAGAVFPEVELVRGLYSTLFKKHLTMTDAARKELRSLAQEHPAVKMAFFETYNHARRLVEEDDEKQFMQKLSQLGYIGEDAAAQVASIDQAHQALCR